ncbi:hypothetical protein J6590_087518 [Homalodisca vitripennis]|nr:hypothetical protein J6590_087518 [Homalodisca vitripennis]
MSFLNDHLADKRPQLSNLGYGNDNETDAGDNDTEKTTEQPSNLYHHILHQRDMLPVPVSFKKMPGTNEWQSSSRLLTHDRPPRPAKTPQKCYYHNLENNRPPGSIKITNSVFPPDQTCRVMVPFNLLVQCIIAR